MPPLPDVGFGSAESVRRRRELWAVRRERRWPRRIAAALRIAVIQIAPVVAPDDCLVAVTATQPAPSQ